MSATTAATTTNPEITPMTESRPDPRAWRARGAALLAVAVLLALLPAAAARADFGVASFDGVVRDGAGNAATQAGSHPADASATIEMNTVVHPVFGLPFPDGGSLRNAIVDLPVGFLGNPTVVGECTEEQLNSESNGRNCPADSQVGVMRIVHSANPAGVDVQLFRMVAPPGVAASFGFTVSNTVGHLYARVRTDGDHGVTLTSPDISQALGITRIETTFWGVPFDPVHDTQRSGCLVSFDPTDACPVAASPRPLISLPTACTAPGVGLETRLRVDSWSGPTDSASFVSHDLPPNESQQVGPSNCSVLPFEPSMTVRATETQPDAPTGLDVALSLPQDGTLSVGGLATAHLRRARVTLPEGMSISPSGADGLAACGDAELGIGTDRPLACPRASKIGSAEATTPLLDEKLTGGVYVRSQASDQPESGEMFRLALVLGNDERGIEVKLPGSVRVDPSSGRVETVFDDNPQLPVSTLRLALKSGPRAPLATPADCGPKAVDVELTSWGGQVAQLTDTFTIDCPGSSGFAPVFAAGTVSPTGASFSPFVARIARDDRQRLLSGVSVDLPEGLLAKLRGVELCRSAPAADGGCPPGSRVGTATVAAGPGPNPFHVQGDVFLTEGYRGAPYGLAVHVHAKAGPYDLGWVRVRQALHVDPATARASVVSDPLPQIVKGVPVRLRSVDVDVDRPGFTVNPTSCSEKRIDATLTSIDGDVHRTGSRFQAGDCQALPFRPRLSLALTGKRQRTTGRHPGVRAVVRQSGIGEAGIGRARVTLPRSLALDPDNADALCEHADGTRPDLENHCPKGSIVGRARARTPLLDRDLVGNVYFVKNVRRDPRTGNEIRTLPMIVVALRGEIAINLTGTSSTARDGRLVNTFAYVPDAPIARFALNIDGGSDGILAVTRTGAARIDLCARPKGHFAQNAMTGHNGRQASYRVRVKAPCGRANKAKRRDGRSGTTMSAVAH